MSRTRAVVAQAVPTQSAGMGKAIENTHESMDAKPHTRTHTHTPRLQFQNSGFGGDSPQHIGGAWATGRVGDMETISGRCD